MTLSQDPPNVVKASKLIAGLKAKSLKTAISSCSPVSSSKEDYIVKSQVSLAGLTSFRVGGTAEWYTAPRRLEELQASFEWARGRELPITILGAGSNLLISDYGLPGLVISTRYLRHLHFDPELGQVTAGAGEPLPRLAWQAAQRGWQGLEWIVGIPGTVGGAVVMNAGAHGDCTADLLVSAHVLNPDATVEILTLPDLNYSYRTSSLQDGQKLVTQATFQLKSGADPDQVLAATSAHLEQRRSTQPYHLPSCGSVFRNPGLRSAGWLIEQTGLKGYKIGGAQVANRHANFILNCGGATATDIYRLINHVQQQVAQRWGTHLEPEVKILGEFPTI